MATRQLLTLRRTGGRDTGKSGSRDTGKREPLLSRGGTDSEGKPTGKIVGTKEGNPEKGF